MIVFLDFEASSLSKDSFPVEVAWVFEDGRSRSFLIRPAPDWTDWSEEAERIHGISRAMLEAEGVAVERVAEDMLRDLEGHELYASAPSWDGKWLSVLLRGAGLPRHALRLEKSDEAFRRAAARVLGDKAREQDVEALVAKVIDETEPVISPAHRALPDAELERQRWLKVLDRAASLA